MFLWKKYKQLPIQAKASLWYTICSFLQKGISLIVVPIYVRLLTTGEYGEWNVFQAWRDILIIFASLNLSAGVFTKTLVDREDCRDAYTSSMQALGTLITCGMLVLYLLLRPAANRLLHLNTPLMLLLFLYFIVYPAFSFWGTRQRVEYRYKPMVVLTVLMSLLTPTVSLLLLRFTDLRAKAMILGYLLVQCGVGLVFYVVQFWRGKCFYSREFWLYALRFNIPLVPHYLSLIVLNQADRIMIEHYCGESDAGIYSFAYQLGYAINVLISAINGSRVPWTYEQFKNKVYDRLKPITNSLALMLGAAVLLVSLMAPEVIKILGTAEYTSAMYVIPVVTLGIYYTYVYDLYASIEFYFAAPKFVMYASVTGALLNVVLNAIFIPRFSFIAAAYTTLACYLVFMLMHFLFSRRVLRREKITDPVYDNKALFGISALVTAVCLASMLTFTYPLLRLGLALALLGVCYLRRNAIKQLLTTIKK